MRDDKKMPDHESHGLISLSRIYGGMEGFKLYGVPFRTMSAMRIRITNAKESFSRVSGTHRIDTQIIAEVELSATQFAELITTPNMGCGVPCTIKYIREAEKGKTILHKCEPPDVQLSDSMKTKEAFEEEVEGKLAAMEEVKRNIGKLLDEARLSNKRKNAILHSIWEFMRLFNDSAPFMMEKFEKAAAQSTQDMKAEVTAFVEHVVRETGIAKLKEESGVLIDPPKRERIRLEDGDPDAD